VWDTIEGALTDSGTELFWSVFGNPTRNQAAFASALRPRASLIAGAAARSIRAPWA
jgi:hypothetical protein